MKYAITAPIVMCTAALVPGVARAQDISAEEAADLRAQVAALKAKVERLEARLDGAAAEQTGQAEQAGQTGQAGQAARETASAAPPPTADVGKAAPQQIPGATFKGAPQFRTASGWSFKPGGRIQIDAAYVGAPAGVSDPGLGFSSEIRRLWLGVQGDIPGGFGYKANVDFADNKTVVFDAFMTYSSGKTVATVGQHNNFQSLEELTSSLFTSFTERAAFTDAFNFERRLGLSVARTAGDVLLQGGVFTANVADLADDASNSYSLDGRAVYMPRIGRTQLHLAGSLHYRDAGSAGAAVRYRQRPFVHSSDTRFLATPALNADSETGYGLEAAVIRGRFHAAGEAYWLDPDLAGAGADPGFFGGYAEAGLFLTDDSRGYTAGRFDRTKVTHPLGKGGIGAVQVNLRYDRLDLDSGAIAGGKQDGYAASLIWIPVDFVRFIVNYAHLSYQDAAIADGTDRNYGVDVVGVRSQVDF